MSIGRWMHKGAVVHIYNVILLSHEKEHVWVSSKEVDEPRAYYIEWRKSERERQILYSNAYVLPLWLSWEIICLQCERPGFNPWVGKIPCRRERLPLQENFPGGSGGKSVCLQCGRPGFDLWWGRPTGEGNGNPFQYSCLENLMDWGDWWAAVHRVTKSWTQLSYFTFTFSMHMYRI